MPKELDVKISYRCNNACSFCINSDKRGAQESYSLIKKSVTDFAKQGGEKLIVSGGEPLISENFFNLLSFSKDKGINVLEVQTNARALSDEKIIKNLKKFEPISFLVSFHFPNANLYHRHCRSNGFYQTVEGVRNLLTYNFDFTVNTVVMRANLSFLEEMMVLLKKIGVKGDMQYRFPDGKNFDNYEALVPRYKECVPLVEKVIRKYEEMSISLREFPFCVLSEDIRNSAKLPLRPRINLSKNRKIAFASEIRKQHFSFPNCEKCLYRAECFGVRKEYIDNYGSGEFSPIDKK